ncbi:ABC transporter, ATP-binding protein [Cutibacterium acnes HL063PA1]|nr:ABC transporter, ATP-binding protein [Cutibacterium acnes HL063PA1]
MVKRFLGVGKVQVGLAIMLFFILVAILGQPFCTHVLHTSPYQVDYMTLGGTAPGGKHWLGTTSAGQDVLAWMLYGTRNSVVVGLASAVIGTVLTVVIGTWAGFSGGWIDRFLDGFILVFANIPTFAILFMIAGVMQNAGWLLVSLVIGCFEWSGGARQIRAQAMSLRGRDFTTALRTIGESQSHIVLSEVMPHLLGLISPMFLRLIAAGVNMQASLAFLGIGDPSMPSWGLMINWAMTQNALFRGLWWWFIPPGLALALNRFRNHHDQLRSRRGYQPDAVDQAYEPHAQVREGQEAGRSQTPYPCRGDRCMTAQSSSTQARHGMTTDNEVLLEVKGLCVDYVTESGNIRACDNVNFLLRRGEILGVAGESACGKSTLLNALGRLQRMPAATSAGQILFHDRNGSVTDLATLSEADLKPYRWTKIAVVMQSAMACLNPILKLSEQFIDVQRAHDPSLAEKDALTKSAELLEAVGISADRLSSFPFQLSGGMQQRALIALSLVCEPDLVLMDEPTTAVDVVMQRQILQEVLAAQKRLGFSIVFVTHDLSLLMEISDKIAIMYAGQIVEVGTPARFHSSARHPYTRGLRLAFPPLSEPLRRLEGIKGSPPDLLDLPTGCAFAPRCEFAMPICHQRIPELRTIDEGASACYLSNGELSDQELADQQKQATNHEEAIA